MGMVIIHYIETINCGDQTTNNIIQEKFMEYMYDYSNNL